MELDSLKKTWDKLAVDKELDETQFKDMLRKKTRTHMDRIERNIKIGLIILLSLLVLFILDDFILSPKIAQTFGEKAIMPAWAQFLTVFSNTLIFTTFIYFVISFFRIKKGNNSTLPIRETIIDIISTLKVYKRLFYLATFTFLFTLTTVFFAGLYEGIALQAQQMGVSVAEIETRNLTVPAIILLVIFVMLLVGLFLFLRWGYNRLYGDYIIKLKATLTELNSIEG